MGALYRWLDSAIGERSVGTPFYGPLKWNLLMPKLWFGVHHDKTFRRETRREAGSSFLAR